MRFLYYLGAIVVLFLIYVVFEMMGIQLGGLVRAILAALCVYLADYLYKKRSE